MPHNRVRRNDDQEDPWQTHLNSDGKIADEGRPQGGEGTHKGRPYLLSSLGVMPWGGHPQGAPLPIRHALGRAPTRGAPTDSLCPGEGAHKGRPYRFASHKAYRCHALGRAPTRGAPTDSPCLGEGAHKGRPYLLSSPGVMPLPIVFSMPWGGHPQGAPLPIRHALGRAPTRGAPTDSLCPAMPWGGHPQGVPLPIRYALGRAPTRGAPTRFRQPHVGLSQLDGIALQEDRSLLHEVQARGRMTSSQQSSGTN